uniref:Integrase catalytic domain-containing protein n=1 Tax=Musca domestica TaxID=7370 RepID=A0A1I8NJ86_MUSDO
MIQLGWDETIPAEIVAEWKQFVNAIATLNTLRMPRWVSTARNESVQLHGFSDASEKAYAAVVYVKCNGNVHLLTSKTKVNPIKNRKTLPKLELCAAHLLANLLKRVRCNMKHNFTIYAWSDSTIVLSWINNRKNSNRFIRKKVSEISELPNTQWSYVPTKENPADLGSRGVLSIERDSIWWKGPTWLQKTSDEWPSIPQQKRQVLVNTAENNKTHFLDAITEKCSSFGKLRRIVAYVLRFVEMLRGRKPNSLTPTVVELEKAEKAIIQRHQELLFPKERRALKDKEFVSRDSGIASLYPFIDKDGIIRVGGRLHNASMQFNQKHPIILQRSHLAEILVAGYHTSTLHGGNRLTETAIKRKYWIIGVRRIIKKHIRNCSKCIRFKQETSKQLMGNLPEPRVIISHPFLHTGVDYAGPISMKCSRGRGQKTFKGYIAVFVCMATKAIHLEAVSDLTTEAFIAALKRFLARRGKCAVIYSDNGTNFVGASRKLDKDFKAAIKNNSSAMSFLTEEKVQWKFIPPGAPHQGGIWEASVKSIKYHINRVIGESKLTYEEMSTLLCQIEAMLNSRPLTYAESEDIESLDILSPAHFLIGRSFVDEPEHTENLIGSLNRWKLIQKMKKDFWNKWKDEYLTTLQHRRKWSQPQDNLQKGDVVIVKDETTHPAKWPLGLIEEVFPGKDGKVRVVSIKLQNGCLKRPVQKVCPLAKAEE